MNSPTQIRELDFSTPAFFRIRAVDGAWLLTNQIGDFIFLDDDDFHRLRTGSLEDKDDLYERLAAANLIRVDIDIDEMAEQLNQRRARLTRKPAMHRIVVTDKNSEGDDHDEMSIGTAENVVNLLMESASTELCVTFVGGDPFLNWPAIQHIVDGLDAGLEDRPVKIQYAIESNLEHLKQEQLPYLVEKSIYVSTMLHGPELLHDTLRDQHGGGAFATVSDSIERLRSAYAENEASSDYNYVEGVVVLTDHSPDHIDDIIQTYAQLGIDTIAVKAPETDALQDGLNTFLATYEKLLAALVEHSANGGQLISREAAIIANRVIGQTDAGPLFPEFPVGPGLETLCIGPHGDISTSGSGRRAALLGYDLFQIGHVSDAIYGDLMGNDVVQSMTVASVLEGNPGCVNCAYLPYCGVSPEYNLMSQASLAGRMLESNWCQFMLTLQTFVFRTLKDARPSEHKVLEQWAKRRFAGHFNLST